MNPKKIFVVMMALVGATFVISLAPAFAQVDTAWVRRYNGIGNGSDRGNDIVVDINGNVYVTGYSHEGADRQDYTTIKYNAQGETIWVRHYDRAGWTWDEAKAIALGVNGNVYITGSSALSSASCVFVTMGYSSNGDSLWTSFYGAADRYSGARAIATDADGNIYVTGIWENEDGRWDQATVKYDSNGNRLWDEHYNPDNNPTAGEAIAVDGSGNVYTVGYAGHKYYQFITVVKYDTDGDTLWARLYGGAMDSARGGEDIAIDSTGNVYVTGDRVWVCTTIKYDRDGDTIWVREVEATYIPYPAIAVDNSGNVYVTVESEEGDYQTTKYNAIGDSLWTRYYNGPGDDEDTPTDIAVDGAGNVYVTGASRGTDTYDDIATIKYDTDGATIWEHRYNGPGNDDDRAKAIALDDGGNVYVTGSSQGVGTYPDIVTIKYIPIPVTLVDPPDSWCSPPLKVSLDPGYRVITLRVTGVYNLGGDYEVTTDHPKVTCIGNCAGYLLPEESRDVDLLIDCAGQGEFIAATITIRGWIGTEYDTTYEIVLHAVCSDDDYYECLVDPRTWIEKDNCKCSLWVCCNTEQRVWDKRLPWDNRDVIFSSGVIVATTVEGQKIVGRQDYSFTGTGTRDTMRVVEGPLEYYPPYDEPCIIQKVFCSKTFICANQLAPPLHLKWFWIAIFKEIIMFHDLPPYECPNWKKEQIIKHIWIEYGSLPIWWPDQTPYVAHEDIYLGVFADINAPFDEGCNGCNTGGYEDGVDEQIMWQHGWYNDTLPEGHDYFDDYYVGMALTDRDGNAVVPRGAQNVLNEEYLYPQEGWGWVEDSLYDLAATEGVHVHYGDLVDDRTVVMTAGMVGASGNPADIDLEFILIEAFIKGETGTGLQELVDHIILTRSVLIPELRDLGLFKKEFPLCGDATEDGIVNIADVVYLVSYLFTGGAPPSWPFMRGDCTGDCVVNIADVVCLVSYLFAGGDPPTDCCGWGRQE